MVREVMDRVVFVYYKNRPFSGCFVARMTFRGGLVFNADVGFFFFGLAPIVGVKYQRVDLCVSNAY